MKARCDSVRGLNKTVGSSIILHAVLMQLLATLFLQSVAPAMTISAKSRQQWRTGRATQQMWIWSLGPQSTPQYSTVLGRISDYLADGSGKISLGTLS